MKRLLVLNYEFPPLGGGASPVSYKIAEELSKNGEWDIDVVTMGYKDLPKYEEINKNFRIHRVKGLRSKKEICHPYEQFTYLIFAYFECKELIKKNKYNICHTHFALPTGILALKLKKRFNLNYIISSHGSDLPGYNQDRFRFLHKFTKSVIRAILNNSEACVSGSEFLAELGNQIKPNKKYIVIREGFDREKFIPQEKYNWIFTSGRLLHRKGFQYLIEAVRDQDIGYEVHIAGDGPMREELERLAKDSKTKIIFHGWLDNQSLEYKHLLQKSAIYVLASEKENASVALLEAMSAGCAIISTNSSGCRETVGEAGILINPKDVNGLQKALDNLIYDKVYQDRLGRLARERILQVYNIDDTIKEYSKLL